MLRKKKKKNEIEQPPLSPELAEKEKSTDQKAEPIDKKKGRRVIMVVFLTTVLASIFFYLQPQVVSWWQTALVRLSGVQGLARVGTYQTRAVARQFRTETDSLSGSWSFWVIDPIAQTGWGENEEEDHDLASLRRLPKVVAGYRLVEEGEVLLSQKVEIIPADRRLGPGDLKEVGVGQEYTLAQFLDRAVADQDPTAIAVLERVWGDSLMTQLDKLALAEYQIGQFSALEVGVLGAGLVGGDWLGELTSRLLAESLAEGCSQFESELFDLTRGCQFDFSFDFNHGLFITSEGKILVLMSTGSDQADFFAVARFLLEQGLGSD